MSWYELLVKSQIAVAVDLLYSVREVLYSADKVKDTLHQAQCTHIDTMYIQYSLLIYTRGPAKVPVFSKKEIEYSRTEIGA